MYKIDNDNVFTGNLRRKRKFKNVHTMLEVSYCMTWVNFTRGFWNF